MIPEPRPEIGRLVPPEHGGRLALGVSGCGLLDFSTTVHAYGPPARVRDAVAQCNLDEYPDPHAADFCAGLAERFNLPTGLVMAGNGSVELLRLVGLAYIRQRDPVVVVGPTFEEYRMAAEIMGGEVQEIRAQGFGSARPDVQCILDAVRRLRPRVTFLCNPNNPTGTYWDAAEVQALLRACHPGLLVMDGAFQAFVESAWDPLLLVEEGPILLIRSMTKDYAMAGLRLGYAIGAPSIMGAAGYQPEVGATHFFLLRVEDGRHAAQTLHAQGFLVRLCSSFGLPRHIRISPRRPLENESLVRALSALQTPARAL
ncbi:MAG: histidinol-phosphate aminotransferase family protein [candidate division NC10 bacterium]|nr:histidinol-phosphate aminotransferase family protein [candidate division NC10 bacterium]